MGEEEAAPEMETVAVVRAFKAAAAVMGFGCKRNSLSNEICSLKHCTLKNCTVQWILILMSYV